MRRPELATLFRHYVYGIAPEACAVSVADHRTDDFDDTARMHQIRLSLGGKIAIDLLLIVPKGRRSLAPVFLGLNFAGNHTVANNPHIWLPRGWMPDGYPGVEDNSATESGRGTSPWPIEEIVRRGYAVATVYHGDIEPDHPDAEDGVIAAYREGGYTWGAIAAWAWGLSRVADYLVSRDDIDAQRMIVFGHSRNGKAALLAGALDERFALVIPCQSGCTGAAPSRTQVGETVETINRVFPYWFTPTYHRFGDRVERLPIDQHCLLAMLAPRPVLLTNATEDSWANPLGQFEMLKAAEPVYRLHGVEGCAIDAFPAVGELVSSRLGYFIRPGQHAMTDVEWRAWMDFAGPRDASDAIILAS